MTLTILWLLAMLALAIVLLAILRSSRKPMPPPEDEWGSHDEPFEYDSAEEARNDYTMETEDDILRAKGIL